SFGRTLINPKCSPRVARHGVLNSKMSAWVEQATGLCRPATCRTEWKKRLDHTAHVLNFAHHSLPVGESPTGTGRLPVPPNASVAPSSQRRVERQNPFGILCALHGARSDSTNVSHFFWKAFMS